MKKYLYGVPTILGAGFLASFMWGMVLGEVPTEARHIPSTSETIEGFKRIRDNMPNMDTFLGIREVLKQINQQLGNGR